jgi:hypothetical protein
MDLSKLSTSTSAQSIVGTPPKYSYKAGTYTIFNKETGQIETVDINKIGGDLRSNIDNIIKRGTPWPQASIDKGFLSPYFIGPSKDFRYGTTPKSTDQYTTSGNVDNQPSSPESNLYSSPNMVNQIKVGEYEYVDWMGQLIKPGVNSIILDTDERFSESKDLPKKPKDLKSSPYSTRDYYLLFNDTRTDYFKHGLQIIDNLTPIENPENGKSELRLSQFQQTPFENNDPVMFGFEIIIDDISSPLLNGSVLDFLKIYSGVDEIKYKIPVYEDFKQQFVKLFRTKTTVNINDEQVSISKTKPGYANTDSSKDLFRGGKTSYMSYYLKKIGGLGDLIESNTTDKKKYLVDYRTDTITLDFTEDVSLTMGTLAHLYKLLYWSKPNGKGLVPENLLRFNCDIIVSECRNFNRVRKAMDNGDLEVIKDNLSRYVYSLKECQFFFNTMPHNPDIDMSAIATYDTYGIQFDYKYSTVKFERFMPSANFGKYIGYDGGAIWKIGNPGARVQRGGTQSTTSDTSLPRFFTSGTNTTNSNGVKSPTVLNRFGVNLPENPLGFTTDEKIDDLQAKDEEDRFDLDKFKRYAKDQTAIGADLSKLVKEQNKQLELLNSPKTILKTTAESAVKNFTEKNKTIGIPTSLKELTSKKADTNIGNFIERLKDKTIKSAKQELATLVNGRVSLLSRTINKLLIDFVGRKGISPPQNIYTGPQDPMGIALTNTTDRFFYDIRNELANFAGGAVSNVLNSGISSLTRR